MGSKKHSANSPQTLQFVFLRGTKRWARCFTRFKIPCFPSLPTAVYCAVEISAVLRNHRRPNISVANEWIFVSFCTKKSSHARTMLCSRTETDSAQVKLAGFLHTVPSPSRRFCKCYTTRYLAY